MGYLIESAAVEIFSTCLVVLWSLYCYITWHYNYWQKRGVPCVIPQFPLGSLPKMMLGQNHMGQEYDKCSKGFQGKRYFGVIEGRVPALVVKDPELIKRILTKDFHYFSSRLIFPSSTRKEYINFHLFNMNGNEWRDMRLTITPTFTSGKMKMMYSLLEKCSDQLKEHVDMRLKIDPAIDLKDLLARFTLDSIATCAFGLETDSMSDKESEFYKYGAKIFQISKFRTARRIWYSVVPFLSYIYAPPLVQTDTAKFLTKIVKETVSYREKNNVNRNDFLNLLIKIRQNKSVDVEEKQNGHFVVDGERPRKKAGLTIEQIIAQTFVFFAAGFETASSTASFCLYELACNPEIQEKLYQEINEILTKHGGKPTYQALQEMVYMDQVINETLRRYASLSLLNRTCTETYRVPDSDLTVEKGTKIVIPLFSIHHDPKIYPEPYKFDPERFTPERVKERHPYVHLPFGEGPRMCIGMRFGLLQTKTALTTMLHNFRVVLTPETEIPVKLNTTSTTTQSAKPILLRVEKREMF